MAAKSRKPRPNEIAMDLSDVPSCGVVDVNGHEGGATEQAAGLTAQERDLKAAGAQRIFGEQVSSSAKTRGDRQEVRHRTKQCLPGTGGIAGFC